MHRGRGRDGEAEAAQLRLNRATSTGSRAPGQEFRGLTVLQSLGRII